MDEYRYIDGDGDQLRVQSNPEEGKDGIRIGVDHLGNVFVVDVLPCDVPIVARAMYHAAGLEWPQVTHGDLRGVLAPVLATMEQLQDMVRRHLTPAQCGAREHIPGVTGDGLWVWCTLKPGHSGLHEQDRRSDGGALVRWEAEPGL